MPDIFISYSRKDSEPALVLAERLRSQGLDCWIDQRGIEGAERWATEIVEGIRACPTFLVLLSPNSVASEHVLRELSIASEKRKRLLPVDLLATELPASFEYALAGLQRVAIGDFEGIVRAHAHGVEHVNIRDDRKSLMILPFEDLSPAEEDNTWFADGITGELISALSNIKSLRIPDRKTSMELKGFRGRTSEIARELDVRYFIEGNVRKFGEQIKISLELLDIETGDYLWQHSFRGEFKDIFDIQEQVANEVVHGLKLHLTHEEERKINDHGTENAEAYELYVKGKEYLVRQTKQGFLLGIQLFTEAIGLDPKFADAYRQKASALTIQYRNYDRNPHLLNEAERLAKESLRLRPDLYSAYFALMSIYLYRGKLEEAELMAKKFVEKDPENFLSHFSLGFFYGEIGQHAKAIAPFEETVRLRPDYLECIVNLAMACDEAGEKAKCAEWAEFALPQLEHYLKLHPDDEAKRVEYVTLLFWSGRKQEAHRLLMELKDVARDGFSLYMIASLFGDLDDGSRALESFRRSLDAGLQDIRPLQSFLAHPVFKPFHGTPEFDNLVKSVEHIAKTSGQETL